MSDLRRWLMNPEAHAAIDSREVFDPASLDDAPMPEFLEDTVDELDPTGEEDVTVMYGRLAPRMLWELLP